MNLNSLFFAVVFILFSLTGCASGPSEVVNGEEELSSDFPPSMTGTVIVNGKTYEMEEGNSMWERKKGEESEVVQTDASSPSQISESSNAIEVEPNTVILIEIERDPVQSVYLWNEDERDQEIKLANNHFAAPSSEGCYVYEVFAEWQNGEVSYTFVVEVN
ncbi:hypothetical protein B0H99_10323 [Planomicrobium soli]|uniref:Uncharacterized protein n=1 Tax=Planomicrobium soli TaxID=1176648 RepID=A0A2P8H3U5_9BACL|nr:hypothetical protein [Planomicrobium soli]PSL40891.1 hypothetical protein B0H99_10323 [Planomicrobium soli]